MEAIFRGNIAKGLWRAMTTLYLIEITPYAENFKLKYRIGYLKLDEKVYKIAIDAKSLVEDIPAWMRKLIAVINDDKMPGFPLELLEKAYVDTRHLTPRYRAFSLAKWDMVFGKYTPRFSNPNFHIGMDHQEMSNWV